MKICHELGENKGKEMEKRDSPGKIGIIGKNSEALSSNLNI